MDVCKISPGCYQYTAVDDCSRYIVVGLFERRTAQIPSVLSIRSSTRCLLRSSEYKLIVVGNSLPTTCRNSCWPGRLGFARTALEEFWSSVELGTPDLERHLQEWQHHYNWDRPHTALGGCTPIDRCCELIAKTPLREEVAINLNPRAERWRVQHYPTDLAFGRLRAR